MKRRILLFLAILALPLAIAAPVSAQFDPFEKVCENGNIDATACEAQSGNPISGEEGVLMRVVEILALLVGMASVVMVILGGLKYVTSGGDANSISSAKNTILYALVGLGVFAISEIIIYFVIGRL